MVLLCNGNQLNIKTYQSLKCLKKKNNKINIIVIEEKDNKMFKRSNIPCDDSTEINVNINNIVVNNNELYIFNDTETK